MVETSPRSLVDQTIVRLTPGMNSKSLSCA
jgi:hypothetical protein